MTPEQNSYYQSYEADSLELNPDSPFFWDHITRYWWAASYASGKDVLDCACGKGYGSYVLAGAARQVCGIDLNPDSLALAKKFQRENLEFRACDVLQTSELKRSFDLIVAFEVIEHLLPEQTENFLQALAKSLKPGGKILLSTPNHDVVLKSGVPVPEFHINNFRAAELRAILKRHFSKVEMLGQFRERGALNHILFSLDRWNLRHLLRRRPPSAMESAPLQKSSGVRLEALEPYLSSYPEGAKKYRFSASHWRQAGLTVAVLAEPRLI